MLGIDVCGLMLWKIKMAAASELWPFVKDEKEHELILGKSFETNRRDACAFHTIRYDFKPASVDSSKPAELAVGEKDNITVTVPHIQDSGSTVYKGSKRPCPKEFLLIIDKKTQTFTLERIESTIPQLKKIRSAAPSKSSKVPTSTTSSESAVKEHASETTVKEQKQNKAKSPPEGSNTSSTVSSKEPSPVQTTTEEVTMEGSLPFSSSDSSSSDSEEGDANSDINDDDDDDDEVEDIHVEQLNNFLSSSLDPGDLLSKKQPVFNQLCEDLELSESGSDSD